MKENLKNLVLTVSSMLKVIRNYPHRTKTEDTEEKPQPCYVFGNGPSLKTDILGRESFYAGKTVCCVNLFVKSESYELIRPAYYVFLDPLLWDENATEDMLETIKEAIGLIRKKTTWNITIYIPFRARRSILWKSVFDGCSNIHVCFFNDTLVEGYRWFRLFAYKKNIGIPPAQNVLVMALFLALNNGFKKIYLLGADHSWHKELELNESRQVCFRDHHFYDKREAPLVPFYDNTPGGRAFTMHGIFSAIARMFYGYEVLNDYAEVLGAKISNASSVTYIDAFERCDTGKLYDEKPVQEPVHHLA